MSIHNNSRETVWRGSSSPQQDNAGRINSLDFHRREDLLVTAGDDDSVHLYNIQSGTMDKTVFSRKYGVSHIRFTHHPQSVVYASNKVQCVGLHAPMPGVQLCVLRRNLMNVSDGTGPGGMTSTQKCPLCRVMTMRCGTCRCTTTSICGT